MIASFDIGTTAVKGVLLSGAGQIRAGESVRIETIYRGDWKEQRPEEWYEAFCRISRIFSGIAGEDAVRGVKDEIEGIVLSGQMQDVIPVGSDFKAVGHAILYSDGRGGTEAETIAGQVRVLTGRTDDGYIPEVTGNHFDGSLTLPKILWYKTHCPEKYAAAAKFLISSKDYVIGRLTGSAASDVTSCSTAGAMNIRTLSWDSAILKAAEVSPGLMPRILHAHEIAGYVTASGGADSGWPAGTPVYAGSGDAGATTLASGISSPGEYNINLGTTGWVAMVSDGPIETEGGVFNLAAMPEGRCINVVPFLNAGNVHNLMTGIFTGTGGRKGDALPDYAGMDALLEKSVPGSGGVMFLPYITGERFPVFDASVRGTWTGISAGTTAEDLARSALEGVAFSIRQGIESIGIRPRKVSMIGGGARVRKWAEIMASVLEMPVLVYRDAEVLPAMAAASAVLLGEGKIRDYGEFTARLQGEEYCAAVEPDPAAVRVYRRIFPDYRRLYPAVRDFYRK